ncbi:MAG: DUF4160 domain-containing protein [Gammaproteobacteria bacterium]
MSPARRCRHCSRASRARRSSAARLSREAGSLPRRQQRLVEAWAELHEDELLADWQLLQSGRVPLPIAPL